MQKPDRAHLNIVPLGVVDELAVSVVAAHLQAVMGLNTDVRPRQPKPEYAYQHGRRQYDAAKIINALATDAAGESLTLGVTRYDICTPILTFVFGESQLGGHAALISLYRIADEKKEVTCTRAAKIGLHEVGHLLGVGHCRTPDCLMCFSANLEILDQLPLWFCDACTVEISRRLRHLFTSLS
jgi:archaemetzincin